MVRAEQVSARLLLHLLGDCHAVADAAHCVSQSFQMCAMYASTLRLLFAQFGCGRDQYCQPPPSTWKGCEWVLWTPPVGCGPCVVLMGWISGETCGPDGGVIGKSCGTMKPWRTTLPASFPDCTV